MRAGPDGLGSLAVGPDGWQAGKARDGTRYKRRIAIVEGSDPDPPVLAVIVEPSDGSTVKVTPEWIIQTTPAREYTSEYVAGIFRDPLLRDGLINSFIIAVLTTGLCLAMSLPLAVIATSYDFRGKSIFSALVLVPLILPPFVGAIGLRQLLGRYGALNALLINWGWMDPAAPTNWLGGEFLSHTGHLTIIPGYLEIDGRIIGVVLMEALHLYPIIFLNVTAALANIDSALEQAAENLGASRWYRFRRITLPLILPGLFAGGTIVFIWSFTELGTPLMFDYYNVTPVQVFWGIQEMSNNPRPYALVAVMLGAAVMFYLLGKYAFGGRAYAMATRAASATSTRRLTGGKALLAVIPFAIVTLLAVMPHFGVIVASFAEPGSWYRTALPTALTTDHFTGALTHDLASGSIRNSLVYSVLAMSIDIGLGLLIAWLVVRSRVLKPLKQLTDALAMLPLAVPGLVLAFGFVAMTFRWPLPQMADWFKDHHLERLANMMQVTGQAPNPILFLVIAYAIRRLPYVVRSAVAGLEQTSGELEEAAVNLGAGPMYTMRRVVVPLIMANLIAGGLLAFSFAMLEVSDSLILAQTEEHYPITKAIYSLFERLGDGPYIASAMGVWGMALLTLTLVGASLMLGKKLGAVFRV
ncbi:MAG: ABC transporter permease subunit [Phycisphaera sp.]|nr:ABC transporter permease subunit [Phycisphaera sp.]